MSGAHTPGPWRADLNVDDDKFGIFPDTGQMEFGLCWMSKVLKPEINSANAALIASAPDLLGVVLDMFENPQFRVAVGGNPIMVEVLMSRARAAIAKARGQS